MQAEKIWQETVLKLESYVKHPAYQAFVKQSNPVSFDDKQLIINAPNEFARQWMDNNYTPIIKEILREITGSELYITFVVQPQKKEKKLHKEKDSMQPTLLDYIPQDQPKEEKTPPSAVAVTEEKKEKEEININFATATREIRIEKQESLNFNSLKLNPKYRFDNFVVGEGSRIVHAAAVKVAESPGKAYNPLFMYGGVGLGKTHLMQAIGNYIVANSDGTVKVVYITSEQFINDLVTSITNNKMMDFRERYRNIDLLLIDDIQFIGGKESIQVEFFHTFNSLYSASKQIVLTSDRLPKEIAYLEDRLRNRFEMGLTTDIQPPDLETRLAILKKKTMTEGYNIDDSVLNFIAATFQSNVRELEGALTRIIANASIDNKPVTITDARIILQKEIPQEASPTTILRIVADHYHLEVEDLTGKQQTKDIVTARQIAMYVMKEYTNCSLRRIAQIFNKFDHSPVKNAIKNIETSLAINPMLRNEIQKIRSKIR